MFEFDLRVDACGLLCPMPILKTDQAMASLSGGGKVQLLATDPGIERDLPAWCEINGHTLIALVKKGRTWTAIVEKGL
ncbi:MAG: Rhodanese-like domain protein [Magnetococcales bacterium]|nr:Rhodanese-like domain protein [Magnetococcales bacterium]HIJ85030.1 sulfurtransferase TusA family protein [Magnetococcales bacterium]